MKTSKIIQKIKELEKWLSENQNSENYTQILMDKINLEKQLKNYE
ncbi:hypothetical protein [Flavobacterium sp. '19STA2R22 D10 B1']|nr:hypothetical protein [Flavobacterium sp. '19STA2R22 D10 B1']